MQNSWPWVVRGPRPYFSGFVCVTRKTAFVSNIEIDTSVQRAQNVSDYDRLC